jgi:hypothetical protein
MGALPRDRAGVGSAVNDTTRQIGGALGVAVIGSLFAWRYHASLSDLSGLPTDAADAAQNSIAKDSWSLTSGFFVSGTTTVKGAQRFARAELRERNWDESQFTCLVDLWNRESRWNYRAENQSSGAYGIPQALPGNKMRAAGKDWRTNPETQILWGLGYISERYKTPCRAWDHSEENGWY